MCQGFTGTAYKTAALLKFAHHELLIQLSAAGMILFWFGFFWMGRGGTDTVGALKGWGVTRWKAIAVLPARRQCWSFSTK